MASRDFLERKDANLARQLEQMAQGVAADPAAFGISPELAADFLAAAGTFQADLQAHVAAMSAAAYALSQKNASRVNASAIAREISRYIQANPAIPDNMRAGLGLRVYKTYRSKAKAHVPEKLCAVASTNGEIKLTWRPGENTAGTVYLIEWQASRGEPFQILGTSTRCSFVHQNQPVGQYRAYRVRASRSSGTSNACAPAIVWGVPNQAERKAA